MAALIQEINLTDARHIVTVESPIEYSFRPRLAYIRQREVGRDTPSFEQALLDALREDPDVLMVGEMREPQTMQLTLTASETGHLVLATMHSATCAEALQRLTSAFPSDMQNSVRAQLADCLVAVICQRLRYRADLKIRVPELEILIPSIPVKNYIRNGDFFKIAQIMEVGAEQGMWTWARYQTWMEKKKEWHIPDASEHADGDASETGGAAPALPALAASTGGAAHSSKASRASAPEGESRREGEPTQPATPSRTPGRAGGPIEIEPVEGGLSELIKKLEEE
jgi:twitching motility protein PilT